MSFLWKIDGQEAKSMILLVLLWGALIVGGWGVVEWAESLI